MRSVERFPSQSENNESAARLPLLDGQSEQGRRAFVTAACLAAFSLVVSMPAVGNWCLFTPDGVNYLSTARDFANSGGFGSHRLITPPGLPILLAPLTFFSDIPLLGIRVMSTLCIAGAVSITYLLLRRTIGDRPAIAVAGLVAVNAVLLELQTKLLSEPAFLLFLMSTFLVMDQWRDRPPRARNVMTAAFLAASAAAIRSIGVPLGPIAVLYILTRSQQPLRRRLAHAILFTTIFLAPIVAWQVRQSQYPDGIGYSRTWSTPRAQEVSSLSGMELQIDRLERFAPLRFESVAACVLPRRIFWRMYRPQWSAIPMAIGACVVAALLWRFARRRSPVDLYALGTLGLLSLWPWDEGERLVAPLVPVIYAALIGITIPKGRGARFVAATVGVLVVAGPQIVEASHNLRRLPELREKADSRLAAMKTTAAWFEAYVPSSRRSCCVTRVGDESKVIIAGAAYLAHRIIDDYRDVENTKPWGRPPDVSNVIWVPIELAQVAKANWKLSNPKRVGSFAVFSRQ